MPERGVQFDYPENDWAVGKMAKIGPMRGGAGASEFRELEGQRKRRESRVSQAAGYPVLPQEEWEAFTKRMPGGKAQSFSKDRLWNPDLTPTDPQGFMMHKDHPQLNDLKDQFDMYGIPGGKGEYLFLKPKSQEGAAVAEWEGPAPGPGRTG